MLAGMDTSTAPFTGTADINQVNQASKRAIDLIVVHCSATPNGQPLRRGVRGQPGYQSCVQIIDAWHAERGFARNVAAVADFNPTLGSIGYHFVIDIDGAVFTGRGVDEVGAHVAGHNQHSLGICMVGGAERVGQFTAAQWKALSSIVLWQATLQKVPLAPPRRNGDLVAGGVCGHRDLSPDLNHDGAISPAEWLKTCPGFDVAAWLGNKLQPFEQQLWRPPV